MVIIKFTNNFLPDNFTGKRYFYNLIGYFKNDKLHRYYGPARFWKDGNKSWFFNNVWYGNSDEKYNQKQFLKDVSKLWLL